MTLNVDMISSSGIAGFQSRLNIDGINFQKMMVLDNLDNFIGVITLTSYRVYQNSAIEFSGGYD